MVMFAEGGTFVLSPSDLTRSAMCEFGWLRNVDVKLGRIAPSKASSDAMLKRTAVLGLVHEERELARLVELHGAGLVQLSAPKPYTPAGLAEAHATTIEHLGNGVAGVFQATFFDGGFGGMADFVMRGTDGRYQVRDTKLARTAKVSALLQVAAYADLMDHEGIPRHATGALILGDRSIYEQDLDEIIPVYRLRRAKLEEVLQVHLAASEAVVWNDPRFGYCGSCDWCTAEIEASHDVLLVAGLRKTQRTKLRAAGVETIEQLAGRSEPVAQMSASTLEGLRQQAALQVAPPAVVDGREVPTSALIDQGRAIQTLPAPSNGDVFFDFEGDPLWSDNDGTDWGLEYLFGVIEPGPGNGAFRAWWAHDRAQEKQATIDFLDYVVARRADHPDMHVYHYAPYEVTALKRLVGRHATHEDVLDDLLRANVFVDLYQTVRRGIRAGTPSYSIKKLEPLYMGDQLRTGLDNAADSIVEYQRYCEQRLADDPAAAETLADIAEYNEYDCLSTWRLRDWLRSQVGSPTVQPIQTPTAVDDVSSEDTSIDAVTPVMHELMTHVGEGTRAERTDDEQAAAMLAAAVGYHQRENKPFWWAYFDRLVGWPEEWPEPRDSFHALEVEVLDDWAKEGRKGLGRHLRMVGRLEPGSRLKVGNGYVTIYDEFPPGRTPPDPKGRCVGGGTTIREISATDDGRDVLVVRELVVKDLDPWQQLPMGLCVSRPVRPDPIPQTLLELARSATRRLPTWPRQAGLDLLRRVPPRLTVGDLSPVDDSVEEAILDSVRRLDRSYLAVQGPPGTGKTYVGSRVVKRLVEDGWRVGVVGQSHAVVCNFLTGAVEAGLDPTLIAKPKKSGDGERPWFDRNGAEMQEFVAASKGGCLVGGTAWTFSSRTAVGLDQLDLLVVDEAGQFSLANTLAASTSARRLLLLGDPQQLPQVSQGTHPEPVDGSSLAWVANGHPTLPTDRGYFLKRSWRMHSALTAVVSRLSYESKLHSEVAATDARELSEVVPGVHPVPVLHAGNDVQSVEEAAAVVDLVQKLQRRSWKPEADELERRTTAADVIVVAPYNAQVALLRRALDAVGCYETRVGTVDKFQGQEAPVVIVSMTASSADEVPRGMNFLLNRNRLNVAISRGQWAAFVVHSPALADTLPAKPEGLAELGAFLRVVEVDRRPPEVDETALA